MSDHDSEYRGAERMWLLTGAKSPRRFMVALFLGMIVLAVVVRRGGRRDEPMLPQPRAPSIESKPAITTDGSGTPAEEILAAIRSRGYRVTSHEFVGALEMRAATASAPNRVVQSARVDRPSGSRDAEERCVRELAKKLSIEVSASPITPHRAPG